MAHFLFLVVEASFLKVDVAKMRKNGGEDGGGKGGRMFATRKIVEMGDFSYNF